MNKIKTIALIAPSGDIRNLDEINSKIEILSEKFKVKKYFNPLGALNYLADSDEKRVSFLEQAFLDDEVDLVLSVRGGYGALRIVDKINYDLIKNCNKIYCGSSDASVLLISLSAKTNIKCFHSLMLANGFIENLEENIKIIENNIFDLDFEIIKVGAFKGKLWGGNLSSVVSLLSNDKYLPKEDIILFLEDLNEPIYKIDKMLYEIYRSLLCSKIKGIIFGDFYLDDFEILPLIKEYANRFNVPVRLNKNITHKTNNVTLPYNQFISI